MRAILGRSTTNTLASIWALAVWEGVPSLKLLETCLNASIVNMKSAKTKWNEVADPADVFVCVLSDMGWEIFTPLILRDDRGTNRDFLHTPPRLMQRIFNESAQRAADRKALSVGRRAQPAAKTTWAGPIFWDGISNSLEKGAFVWTQHH